MFSVHYKENWQRAGWRPESEDSYSCIWRWTQKRGKKQIQGSRILRDLQPQVSLNHI